ncbi:MAG TPA: hypothetical protein VKV17_12820 [Bryobacteraceae bacterium]|nr:hypothetical protein [Bryobacteraceae bacterium]
MSDRTLALWWTIWPCLAAAAGAILCWRLRKIIARETTPGYAFTAGSQWYNRATDEHLVFRRKTDGLLYFETDPDRCVVLTVSEADRWLIPLAARLQEY